MCLEKVSMFAQLFSLIVKLSNGCSSLHCLKVCFAVNMVRLFFCRSAGSDFDCKAGWCWVETRTIFSWNDLPLPTLLKWVGTHLVKVNLGISWPTWVERHCQSEVCCSPSGTSVLFVKFPHCWTRRGQFTCWWKLHLIWDKESDKPLNALLFQQGEPLGCRKTLEKDKRFFLEAIFNSLKCRKTGSSLHWSLLTF